MTTSLRTTITESLINTLRDQIRSGAIEPGSRLRQTDIADRFQVSTTPVREAFAALEREGLLISSPHRGVIVFQPTTDDLSELYEIRIPLEALATEKAVENMTDEDLAGLARLLARMAAAGDDAAKYARLNTEFHSAIYASARRPKLERLISDLRDASTAYLRVYQAVAPNSVDTHADHTAIYEACAARAPKRAAEAMTRHLHHTVEMVSASLVRAD